MLLFRIMELLNVRLPPRAEGLQFRTSPSLAGGLQHGSNFRVGSFSATNGPGIQPSP
jgi:hypothetical protein